MIPSYTPQTYNITLKGTYSSPSETIEVDGVYDVSTIPTVSARHQTVLFLESGSGPRQIEIHHYRGHPAPSVVRGLLESGSFHTP